MLGKRLLGSLGRRNHASCYHFHNSAACFSQGQNELASSLESSEKSENSSGKKDLQVLVRDILFQLGGKEQQQQKSNDHSKNALRLKEGPEFEPTVSTASGSVVEKPEDFDYYVIVDFEATCDTNTLFPQEIIEFPAVLVEAKTLKVQDSFQAYVKPLYNPELTDFCKRLTGIEQSQVDAGVPLSVALERHDKWLEGRGVKHKKFGVVTWTDWDCKIMLELECKLKGLTKPTYFNRWINLKSVFENYYQEKGRLKQAVLRAGLEWEGREHSGLDDARNTANLAIELLRRGVRLDYTRPVVSKKPEALLPRIQEILNSLPNSSSSGSTGSAKATTTRASDLCFCGVKCRTRLVTKAGPNQGKYFVSCGHWTISEGGRCTFLKWETADKIVMS